MLAMAILAADHREIGLFGQHVALLHGPMADFAGRSRFEMNTMAERHITRNLVHALPWDRLLLLGESLELPNGGLVLAYLDMTSHTLGRCRQTHGFSRVR